MLVSQSVQGHLVYQQEFSRGSKRAPEAESMPFLVPQWWLIFSLCSIVSSILISSASQITSSWFPRGSWWNEELHSTDLRSSPRCLNTFQKFVSPLSLLSFSVNKNSELFSLCPCCFCLMPLLANVDKADFFFLWLGWSVMDVNFEKCYKLIYLRTKFKIMPFPCTLLVEHLSFAGMPMSSSSASLSSALYLIIYASLSLLPPSFLPFPHPSPLHPTM